MNMAIQQDENEIAVKIGSETVASFEATYGGDLLEGYINETYESKLRASALVKLANWLLEKAADRACDCETK